MCICVRREIGRGLLRSLLFFFSFFLFFLLLLLNYYYIYNKNGFVRVCDYFIFLVTLCRKQKKEEKKKGNNQESVCIDILRNFTCIHRPSVFQHLFVVGFCQRQSSPPTHKWRSVEGLLILPCIGRHCTIVWRPARKLWRGTFIWSSWTSTLGIKLQT